MKHSSRLTILLLLAALTMSCAAERAYKKGQKAAAMNDWDRAFIQYVKASSVRPENDSYKVGVARARIKSSQQHFKAGQRLYVRGSIDDAVLEFERATLMDPGNQYFLDELEKARIAQKKTKEIQDREKTKIQRLKEKVRREEPIIPILSLTSETPISLKFKETDVKEIYSALGKMAGLNILLDGQIREKKISIDLADVTFQQALETLLLINQHYYKVIDPHSIIIIPDNQTKRRQYDEQVIKTFYLSSADINEVQQLVQRLINTRFMSVSKQLNSITIRDTADKVAIAERIIEANDKAKAEVIIDVELLEINRRNFESLGAALSSYTITQTLAQGGGGGGGPTVSTTPGIPLSRIDKLTQNDWFLSFPSITYNFMKQDSDTRLIAKPQIRVSAGEKASILIGDKVPVPTTTFNTNQTVGGNVVPITSFQYQDVGIKINLEPRVHHNKEITLKLKVEVSQIIGVNDSGQPTIGTRTIETVIRLKEGETSLLAGLLREDQSSGKTGVPGLSSIPLLGKLFSQNTNDLRKTDLVLTLTPHIIRLPNIKEEDLAPLYVGTEENTTLRKGPRSARSLFTTEDKEEGVAPDSGAASDAEDSSSAPSETRSGENGGGANDQADDGPKSDDPNAEDSGTKDSGAKDSGEKGTEKTETKPPEPALIMVQPPSVKAKVGGAFSVDILIMQATNVAHVPFYFHFDPALVTVESVAEGDFLKQGGANTSFLQKPAGAGTIIFGCSRLGGSSGASGSGRIATITMRAKRVGQGVFSFSNNAVKDPTTAPLPSDWRDGQVTIAK